jgi:hypothetical protein
MQTKKLAAPQPKNVIGMNSAPPCRIHGDLLSHRPYIPAPNYLFLPINPETEPRFAEAKPSGNE